MYRLGIDLGGTNIAAGVVDEKFDIVASCSAKTNLPRSSDAIADDMAKTALSAVEKAGITMDEIKSVGVGTPGAVDSKTGKVAFSSNLKFFDTPLGSMISERLNKTVFVENDANAAAYGEYIAGAGKGSENFIAITLGTGVGGGIIINGRIYSGSNGAGAEVGHMVIAAEGEFCNCGRSGCWEAYASATALIRQTKQAMLRYPKSYMWQLCRNDIANANGMTAFNAMRCGDAPAVSVVNNYIRFVSIGIANMVNIFQPDIICIGGGISREGKTLTDPINEFVSGEDYARNMSSHTVIKTAALGNDAGIIGAAFLDRLH